MISLINGHIEISPIEQSIKVESIKKAQNKIKKYLQPDIDLVEMLFDDRKEEVANE